MFQPIATKNIRRNINRYQSQEMAGFWGSLGKFVGNNLIDTGKMAVTMFVPGGAALQPLLDKIPRIGENGGNSGQAKGLKQIEAFVAQVLSALDSLKQPATEGNSEVPAAADQLVAMLSDQSKVYQAKKGKDAAALANGKTQAANKANELKQTVAAAQQQLAAQAAAAQQKQQSSGNILSNLFGLSNDPNNPNGGGIDSNTLLIAGFGGLALILLLRK